MNWWFFFILALVVLVSAMSASLVKLDVRTTTDQVLYIEPSSLQIFATPLGANLATLTVTKQSLLPVDTKAILAVGVTVSAPPAATAPKTATSRPKKKKTVAAKLKQSPFVESSSSGRLRVAIYN